MFVFKGNGSKHKKSPSFGPYFPHLSHVTWFVGFISFWSHSVVMLNLTLDLNAKLHRPFQYWNLNNICAHNFTKLSLLRAYVSLHKFDITVCQRHILIPDDESLKISGYYLISSVHLSNKKRGGICIYYKNFFPLKVTGVRLLGECIAFWFDNKQ